MKNFFIFKTNNNPHGSKKKSKKINMFKFDTAMAVGIITGTLIYSVLIMVLFKR